MEQSYKKYLSLTQRDLEIRLNRERDRITDLERAAILKAVGEERKRLRSAQAQKKTLAAHWHEVMMPLHVELKTVSNLRRYKTRNYPVPERDRAMTAYHEVLVKLKKLLTQYHKTSNMTPLRLAREKNVPNDGAHWTDWIPAHVKEKILGLFNEIPHRAKAKSKIPFERKEPQSNWRRDRVALTRKVEQELAAAYKDLANDPAEFNCEDHHEYIKRLELAKKALAVWEEDVPIPKTWQAMFGNQLYAYALRAGLDVESLDVENGSA